MFNNMGKSTTEATVTISRHPRVTLVWVLAPACRGQPQGLGGPERYWVSGDYQGHDFSHQGQDVLHQESMGQEAIGWGGLGRLGKYLKISKKHANIWMFLTQKCSHMITLLEELVLQDVNMGLRVC